MDKKFLKKLLVVLNEYKRHIEEFRGSYDLDGLFEYVRAKYTDKL